MPLEFATNFFPYGLRDFKTEKIQKLLNLPMRSGYGACLGSTSKGCGEATYSKYKILLFRWPSYISVT